MMFANWMSRACTELNRVAGHFEQRDTEGLHEPHEVESNKGLLNTTEELQKNLWVRSISKVACFAGMPDLEGNLQTVWKWILCSLTALFHNKWPAAAEDVPWNDFSPKAPEEWRTEKLETSTVRSIWSDCSLYVFGWDACFGLGFHRHCSGNITFDPVINI